MQGWGVEEALAALIEHALAKKDVPAFRAALLRAARAGLATVPRRLYEARFIVCLRSAYKAHCCCFLLCVMMMCLQVALAFRELHGTDLEDELPPALREDFDLLSAEPTVATMTPAMHAELRAASAGVVEQERD